MLEAEIAVGGALMAPDYPAASLDCSCGSVVLAWDWTD